MAQRPDIANAPAADAAIWKALADPTRRDLLDRLRDGPKTTGTLSAAFAMTRFGIMKHLGILEDAGLVIAEKRGRECWNHLNAVPLRAVYERWVGRYQSQWAASLLGLQRVAEAGGREPKENVMSQESLRELRIEQEVRIEAPVARVFHDLTVNVESWWNHRFQPAGTSKVRLDAKLGGLFVEEFVDGGGAIYASVTHLEPGTSLTLTGPMGMGKAVYGVIEIDLEAVGGGTLLKLSHNAIGQIAADKAANYTEGWRKLLGERLKAFAEGPGK